MVNITDASIGDDVVMEMADALIYIRSISYQNGAVLVSKGMHNAYAIFIERRDVLYLGGG